MNKILALFFAVALTAALQCFAEEELKSVIVDVEMPIKNGDTFEAKKASEKMAFEKAVEQILPENLDPKIRADRIKNAFTYIKMFRILEEKQEGQILKLKYRCDLPAFEKPATPSPTIALDPKATLPPAPSTEVTVNSTPMSLTQFELSWKTTDFRLNSSDLMQYISEGMKARVDSFKLGRGSLLLSLQLTNSEAEAKTMLAQYLGPKVNVKSVEGLPTPDTAKEVTLPPGPPAPPQPLVAPNAIALPPTDTKVDGSQKN